MVHYHKLMLVFGFVIEYVVEAASSVRKHMNSEKVGSNDDVGFSDIEQASLIRKQMRADSYMKVSDAEAGTPMRKHKISRKIGASGDVDLVDVQGTSPLHKQIGADVGTEVNSIVNPVSSTADLRAFSGKVAADGHIEMSHLLDSMPTARSTIVRGAQKREGRGINPNGIVEAAARAEDAAMPSDDAKIAEPTVALASKDAEFAALTGNNAEQMTALAEKDEEMKEITAGASEDVEGEEEEDDDDAMANGSSEVTLDNFSLEENDLDLSLSRKGGRRRCPNMNKVIKTDSKLTGKYDYKRSGYTDIDDYLENCKCDCTAPDGWSMVEEGNTGQYGNGKYYVQFMSHWGQFHRRRSASDACRCAKVQQSNNENVIHYDWDGTIVKQSLGTCNTAPSDEYQNNNCYFKACLLHDVCLLKLGHSSCTPFIRLNDNKNSLICLGLSYRSVDSLQDHLNDSLAQEGV